MPSLVYSQQFFALVLYDKLRWFVNNRRVWLLLRREAITFAKQKWPRLHSLRCGLDDRLSVSLACGNSCSRIYSQSGSFSRTEQKYVMPCRLYIGKILWLCQVSTNRNFASERRQFPADSQGGKETSSHCRSAHRALFCPHDTSPSYIETGAALEESPKIQADRRAYVR